MAELQLQQVKLVERLPAVIRGEDRPSDASELIAFADLCYHRQLYARATRLAAEAFAKDAKLAADLRASHRYNAACCAVLAACGKGDDAAKTDGAERTLCRKQALEWLRAELSARSAQMKASPAERNDAATILRHWLVDKDLAGVRDKAALAQMPEAQRKDWEALWAEAKAVREQPVPLK
jgi:hypothetical protein